MWITSIFSFLFLTSLLVVPFLLLPIAFCIFLLPSLIAFNRNHKQRGPILALNLLLGWSFIFWVLALVWALKK